MNETGYESGLFSLADRVILVTGSSSGIGEAIARRSAELGATVVVNSATSVAQGERVAADLPGASYIQADIAVPADRQRLIEDAVAKHGGIDHLVNNAGRTTVIPHHDLEALTAEVWQQIFDVNLFGTFQLTLLALPHLKERRGSVVNITSLAGLRQLGSSIPYSVSKAALNHLTRHLANQLGPEVRVNAVAPGLIETPWTAHWSAQHEAVRRNSPLRRSGTPDDIAQSALALLCNQYTTGEIVLVDGGVALRS